MIKDNKKYKILVVEDNPGDFIIIEDFLIDVILYPVIVHAVNFKQASEILLSSEIVLDIILLDLSLPDKSGNELIIEMLKLVSLCPIVILTGYADINFSIKTISLGIYDYLLKDELTANILYKSIIYSIERYHSITEKVKHIEKIETQNKKLQEIAWIQSHVVRAPLARMMAIVNHINVLKGVSSEQKELLIHFNDSANELDKIIRDISKKTVKINI